MGLETVSQMPELTNTTKTKEKTLYEYQQKHINAVLKIYKKWRIASDTSKTGQGKTFTAVEIAKSLKLPILVFYSGHVKENWQEFATSVGVRIIDLYNYNQLRGVERKENSSPNLKHKYLIRQNGNYVATKELRELIESGVLIIFDEFHHTKNESTLTFQAAKILIQEIVSQSSNSYGLLLSGSPFSDVHNIGTHLCMLGILKNERLFHNETGKPTNYEGIQHVIEWCKTYCDNYYEETKKYADINNQAMNLFKNFISKELVCRMSEPYKFEDKIYNAFFNMDGKQKIEFMKTFENVNKKGATQTKNQILKCPVLIAFAKSILDSVENSKVIVYTDFKEVQNIIFEALKDYGAFILNGGTELQKRTELIDKFQEPNLEFRVAICNPIVAGSGIDLDDQDGDYPRYTLNFLSFGFIKTYQQSGRTNRRETKSQPYFYNICIKNSPEEYIVIRATETKSKITTISTGSDEKIYKPEDIFFESWDINSKCQPAILTEKLIYYDLDQLN